MSYREVMALPMPAFWHLSGSVERLTIAESKEQLHLLTAAQNAPQAAELWATLDKASPHPLKLSVEAKIQASAKPEEGAFDALRNLAG